MIHIIPVSDADGHSFDNACHCGPVVLTDKPELVCVHNAFDQREVFERNGMETQSGWIVIPEEDQLRLLAGEDGPFKLTTEPSL